MWVYTPTDPTYLRLLPLHQLEGAFGLDDEAYRRAMGAASQARARSVLSWESAVRGLIALIDQTRSASSVRTRRRSQRSAA